MVHSVQIYKCDFLHFAIEKEWTIIDNLGETTDFRGLYIRAAKVGANPREQIIFPG